MVLKGQPISFDKENQPLYVYKFNVAMVVFFAAWFVICTPIMITCGFLYGESFEFFLSFGVSFGAFFLGLLILYIVALKLRERIVADRAAELEAKFTDMPLDEATRILKERGVITDVGFVSETGDLFGSKIVPFEKARVSVCGRGQEIYIDAKGMHGVRIRTTPMRIETTAVIYDGADIRTPHAEYELDCALYNFLDKRNLVDAEADCYWFERLKNDKKNFCRKALGFGLK